jgi:polyhydroxyalkanoate synthesis regulator phasin
VKITGEILPQKSENPSGLCASSEPLRQTDPVELIERIDSLRSRVEEARAAAEVIADGDPSAMAELDAEVDAMAEDVAALKAMTSGPPA